MLSTCIMPPLLAGRYQITEVLGGGTFGRTYLAKDMMRPRHPFCVVKELLQFSDRELLRKAQRLFDQEAKILEDLGKHPQIPQLLAHFTEDNQFYLVQEYICGHELRQEIKPGEPWSEERVVELLQDILTTVQFLHENRVIHRDLKPANVMRRKEDSRLVLIDFGAVKQQLSEFTGLTVPIGTKGYMPSEQAFGQPKYCSDLYAVGTIAIEALTGKCAHLLPSDEDLEIIWQPSASHASPQLREVLRKMVRYHFNERYGSAEEVLEELNNIATPTVTPPIVGTENSQSSPPKPVPPPIQAITIIPTAPPQPTEPQPVDPAILAVPQSTEIPLAKFGFEVVMVNQEGNVIKRENKEARYFQENLGKVESWGSDILLDMVAIPGGTFLMGSSPGEGNDCECPQHSVTVPPFFMGKFLITLEQWRRVASLPQVKRPLKSNPSSFEGDRLPVDSVSWYDCEEFCARISRYTKKNYRLPSEAEWEYACRAGTATRFHCGQTLTSNLANYGGKYGKTTPVGNFPPNSFGLYDMHGNLWEWCADCWHKDYRGAPIDGSIWSYSDEGRRLLRGGSWDEIYLYCRCQSRLSRAAFIRVWYYGFRVVLPLAMTT